MGMKTGCFLSVAMLACVFTTPVRGQEEEATLVAGQLVRMSVAGVPAYENQLLSKRHTINQGGKLNLPHIGELSVAGLSRDQAEKKIKDAYVNGRIYTRPVVTLTVGDWIGCILLTRTVDVTGRVKHPGRIAYRPGLRLLEALATAGGFADHSDPARVRVIRDGKTTVHNLRKLSENPEVNIRLKRNDKIIVADGNMRSKPDE